STARWNPRDQIRVNSTLRFQPHTEVKHCETYLYHATNRPTHARASATVANPVLGYSGQYLSVRNSASEYGLSSDTLGRLNDGTTPRRCSVASIVAPFIGPPLSACSTQPVRSTSAFSCRMRSISVAASSDASASCTSQPTILRLHTSSTRYR